MGEAGQTIFSIRAFIAGYLGPGAWKFFLVMAGGSLGAASRYGVCLMAVRMWGTSFPWGTLIVNLAGCFIIGLLFALAEHAKILTPNTRLFLITGYLGALTTFSSFSAETLTLGLDGMPLSLAANMILNNVGGMGLALLGMWVGGAKW